MKTVRVSRGIMNSLYDNWFAYGKKYAYNVRGKVSSGCFIVERYPRYYYHDGVGEGRRLCTLDYARRNGMIEVLQVKEK
jgi:hypothetical protein